MTNPFELMTKAQIVREYGLPGSVVTAAIKSGELSTAVSRTQTYEHQGETRSYEGTSRFYIPRGQVENLIRRRCGMQEIDL